MTEQGNDAAAVPPYEGRKTEAETETDTAKDGVRTAGATAPVSDPDPKAPDRESTPRGATASPADEQPAERTPQNEPDEGSTGGPTHTPGTGRAENKPQ
ncbi:MAG: hypothetical protein QOE97_3410 [Pseudonocardiales bacterium]|jgi:hypothetical protein|nr:hypothetical protein [Pseudonocardiales bacterium]